MPRIVAAPIRGGNWRAVALEGFDIGRDPNLQFLGSFEEMSVEDQQPETAKKKVEKISKRSAHDAGEEPDKNSRKKPKLEVTVENGDSSGEKLEKKKKKPKKNRKKAGPETAEEILKSCKSSLMKDKKKLQKEEQLLKMAGRPVADTPTIGDSEGTGDSKLSCDMSAWSKFYLPDPIIQALSDMGFTTPTEIQQMVLPVAVRDKFDVLGAAETGSGKTLAFAIPAVARLIEEGENKDKDGEEGREERSGGPRVLILAPTRELVVQIRKHIDALVKYTPYKVISIVGGLSEQKQQRLLKKRPAIVVATPGRLWALMNTVRQLRDFSWLRCLVVDETDRMVEQGHFEELEHILEVAKRECDEKKQTLVFSATLTFVHPPPRWAKEKVQLTPEEKIKRLIELAGLRPQHKVIDLTRKFGTAESLVETRINCENLLEKDTALVYLLKRYPGRTLIFTNSVDAGRRLYGILRRLNFEPQLLHAKMEQRKRLKNLDRFTEHEHSILIATDVAARGLDIPRIEHVIHYQVPKTAELYIHRSGRTARASQKGLTVLLVDAQDAQFYRRIVRNLNREKELMVFPIDAQSLYETLKEQVDAASDLDSIEYKIKKIASRENWFVKAAREADLELDEREIEKSQADDELDRLRRQEKIATARLKAALAKKLPTNLKPDLPKTRYVTHEMAREYEKTLTVDALEVVEESQSRAVQEKKKRRELLTKKSLLKKVKKVGKKKKRKFEVSNE